MAKYVYVVMTNAVEGQEAAFNDWYDNQHIGDVMKLPGFRSAQRFTVASEEADNPAATRRHLTLYEIETDDLAATKEALSEAVRSGAMPISPTLDSTSVHAVAFKASGEKILARS